MGEGEGSTYYYSWLSPMASHCCANDTFITFYRFFTLNANLRPFIVAATTILFVSNAQATTIRSLLSSTSYSCLPHSLPLSFSSCFASFFQPLKLIYENVCAEDAAGFAEAQAEAQAQLGSIMLPTNRHMSRCTNTNTHLLAVSMSVCLCVCVVCLLGLPWAYGAYTQCGAYATRRTQRSSRILQQIPNARHEQLLNFPTHTLTHE